MSRRTVLFGKYPGKEADGVRYGTEEALRRTLERAEALRARSFRRRQRALALGTGGCFCALLALGYGLASRSGFSLEKADYGAFLLPSRAGGYILVGVLAFAAGVLVTLLCIRYRNGADPPDRRSDARSLIQDPGGEGERGSPDERAEITEQMGKGPDERRTT